MVTACKPVASIDTNEEDEIPDNIRPIDDESLITVKENLIDYCNHLEEEAECTLDNAAVELIDIDEIVERCGYLLIVEDVLTHTSIANDNIAADIIELLDEVIPMI
jgi:3-dehydroquinate dehydratase